MKNKRRQAAGIMPSRGIRRERKGAGSPSASSVPPREPSENDDLPQGWVSAKIEEITEINPRHPTGLDVKMTVAFVPMPAISENSYSFQFKEERPLGEVRKGYTHFAEGDVLFAKITPCMENGKAAVATGLKNGLGCGTTELHVLRPHSGIDAKYLYYFVHQESFRREAAQNFTGTAGQLRVPSGFIREAILPLAPLKEQRRIVAKLEALLGKVDACRNRLEKIPVILKRFRQSVLAAGCSGRLTTDWRKNNGCDDDLPAGWHWISLEGMLPPGGIFDGPFGSNLKSSDYTESGVRVVRLENVGHLKFVCEKKTFISREKYETLKKHTVGEGDIIFASFIDEETRACLLPKLETIAIAKADCFCLRPRNGLVDRRYLTCQLVSKESYNRLIEDVHGATRPRINTTQLRKLEIRICPLAEQKEIVRRVEALFTLADRIEARYARARARVDRLTQSLLAKAFRGELLPQNPRDEPAEKLLERIRQKTHIESTNHPSKEGRLRRHQVHATR